MKKCCNRLRLRAGVGVGSIEKLSPYCSIEKLWVAGRVLKMDLVCSQSRTRPVLALGSSGFECNRCHRPQANTGANARRRSDSNPGFHIHIHPVARHSLAALARLDVDLLLMWVMDEYHKLILDGSEKKSRYIDPRFAFLLQHKKQSQKRWLLGKPQIVKMDYSMSGISNIVSWRGVV